MGLTVLVAVWLDWLVMVLVMMLWVEMRMLGLVWSLVLYSMSTSMASNLDQSALILVIESS